VSNSDKQPPNGRPVRPGLKPWPKGTSGNPHGRSPSGLASVEKLRAALLDDLPEIIATVVAAAKGGDMAAARTILDRVLPPLKAQEAPVAVGALEGTLAEQGASVLQAMASGALAPGQAAQLLGALAAQAKVREVDELVRRLADLERRVEANEGASNGKR